MIFRLIILQFLLIELLFCQDSTVVKENIDSYPYFSDIKKQMRFEEKKIYYSEKGSIFCNNKELTEIEFLSFIGLDDKAKEIINYHKNELKKWKESPPTIKKRVEVGRKFDYGGACWVYIIMPSICYVLWEFYENVDLDYTGLQVISGTIAVLLGTVNFMILMDGHMTYPIYEYQYEKESPPKFKRGLSHAQLTKLVESYNRNLYREIETN